MKLKISFTLIVIIILYGCQNSSENKSKELNKKAYYESQMVENDFVLKLNGECDDALEDTLHKRSIAYIDSSFYDKSTAKIEFKFKDACCQEFLGNYNIKKDTLIFEMEQVNDIVCSCICWYRYKLEINNIKEGFSEISIQRKKE